MITPQTYLAVMAQQTYIAVKVMRQRSYLVMAFRQLLLLRTALLLLLPSVLLLLVVFRAIAGECAKGCALQAPKNPMPLNMAGGRVISLGPACSWDALARAWRRGHGATLVCLHGDTQPHQLIAMLRSKKV